MTEELIHSYQTGLETSGCHPGADWYRLVIKLHDDISEVLPYLNVELASPTDYRHEQKFLLWKNRDKVYAFRPDEISIATVSDNEEAQKLTERIIETVNSIWKRRNGISPSFEGKKPVPQVLDILKLLPRSNCKECGFATCMAFAAELRTDFMKSSLCPYITEHDLARL
jgi:ArsR family metal-binding transcriptional regulator